MICFLFVFCCIDSLIRYMDNALVQYAGGRGRFIVVVVVVVFL